MKFAFLTTFFGPHSFGGDAVYADRLARALLRRGHQVDVLYSLDAYRAVAGGQAPRPYAAPPGLRLHALETPLGAAHALWIHQTGRSGLLLDPVRRLVERERYDVLHFHNISLLGLDLLRLPARARLFTAHEHWLTCPLSVLWAFGQRTCETPSCTGCLLAARRPPQLWRSPEKFDRALAPLDARLAPSADAVRRHREGGLRVPFEHLPYFLPEDWAGETPSTPPPARPYFVMAGRLVREKGFHTVIPLMDRFPGFDLRIAGAGPEEAALRRLAGPHPNVHFAGRLDFPALRELYRHARALVVPSLMVETFGYVVMEAHAVGTPAIVRDLGALPEVVAESGGGLTFATSDELLAALRQAAAGGCPRPVFSPRWREAWHLERYLALAGQSRAASA